MLPILTALILMWACLHVGIFQHYSLQVLHCIFERSLPLGRPLLISGNQLPPHILLSICKTTLYIKRLQFFSLEGQILINRIWCGPHTSSCNLIHENSVTFYVAYMILITLGGVVLCFWLIDNIDNVVSTGKRIEKCTDFYNLPWYAYLHRVNRTRAVTH